jgi:hypothetical protein
MMYKIQILLFLTFLPSNLYAYIDPGSGSALTAAILALFSGIYFYIKKYYYKLKKKFSSIFSFLKK